MQDWVKRLQTDSWPVGVQNVVAAAPLFALAAVILYAIGFVVVTAYLAGYGVRELEPLRPRYVAAAVPFLAGVGTTWVLTARTQSQVSSAAAHLPALVRALLAAVLYVALSAVIAFFFGYVIAYARRLDVDLSTIGQYAILMKFTSSVALMYWITQRWRPTFHNDPLYTVLLSIGVVFAYMPVYALLPTWVGGGEPDTVRLTLTSSIPGCDQCSGSDVRLIDADTNRLVILVGSDSEERAVEIARSDVIAVSHVHQSRSTP